MEEQKKSKQEKDPPPRGRRRPHTWPYPLELRQKAVRLHLEEGFPLDLVHQETGVGYESLRKWFERYRKYGPPGLEFAKTRRRQPKMAPAVKQKITELKLQQPSMGIKKISQWLRRMMCLQASAETVRRTLHEANLLEKRRPKPRRNPSKPRFFERATPNQMWQSDICTIRLGGQNAYLIGFMDDHSRYLVGLELFRSQTAEHVLEVYRRAVGEYGVPKEMLTDNGRQYTNWRGKTRFEWELEKDHVHHFRSAPHHPMTLGKIERFWKTICEEFLLRAQFESFEQACERIRLWVKYYNHRRPHQGLEGMCPADRFFAIQTQLRQVIEKGIAENVQEMALRGMPKDPAYMVGRIGKQLLVIEAVDGKFKMSLGGDEAQPFGETTDPLTATAEKKGESHEQREQQGQQNSQTAGDPQCDGASAGGPLALDGTAASLRNLPGDVGQCGGPEPVGGARPDGDAPGVGAADPRVLGTGTGVKLEAEPTSGSPCGAAKGQNEPIGEAADQVTGTAAESVRSENGTRERSTTGTGAPLGGADCAGAERTVDGQAGLPSAGRFPQDVLQEGEAGLGGHDASLGRTAGGTPLAGAGSGEGKAPTASPRVTPRTAGTGAEGGDPLPVSGNGNA